MVVMDPIRIVNRLVAASRCRDEETASHVVRVGRYASFIASRLGAVEDFARDIFHAAQLHDVGKIGVPDYVLRKRGPLTSDERVQLRRHPKIGAGILGQSNMSILRIAADIALGHHECWDGSGYPNGLVGVENPLAARITMMADVYDALRSVRAYKRAYTHQEAVQIILDGDGRTMPGQFDPQVLDVFSATHETFDSIYRGFLAIPPVSGFGIHGCINPNSENNMCLLVDGQPAREQPQTFS
ncbi:MAG: HD domain-containing protein [Betaproteobacteria bacterium]|nr:HD domain-containing protein [Betaproteobacteria bacterium]